MDENILDPTMMSRVSNCSWAIAEATSPDEDPRSTTPSRRKTRIRSLCATMGVVILFAFEGNSGSYWNRRELGVAGE